MFHKIKKALPSAEVPLLSSREYGEFVFETRKKSRLFKMYRLFYTTFLFIVVLCICILMFGKFNNNVSIYDKIRDIFYSYVFSEDAFQSGSPFTVLEGILVPSKDTVNNVETEESGESKPTAPNDFDNLYDFDYSAVPQGEIPIIPMDLSLVEYGNNYIHNSTGLAPNINALMNMKLEDKPEIEFLSNSGGPKVLIIHTHGTETYSKNGAISYLDDGTDITRSFDTEKNVVAVGRILKERLVKAGINTLHCEIMHDETEYRNSYNRSAETIRRYLELYPTIELVIDLHRDAILKSSGELVRPVTVADGEVAAQVMCVVGSNWGGESNPNWERNLALALQLRKELNDEYDNICRPAYLKSSTYNQELSKYSLLLEIGSSGNSLEEALVSAEKIADAIISLSKK